MKKTFVLVMTISALALAIPPKGGIAPCMATCCFGPRVGLEMNEGTRLSDIEYQYFTNIMWGPFTGDSMNEVREREKLGGVSVKAPRPAETGGCNPLFTSCCIGPRVAYEMNDGRKVRSIEWWYVGLTGVNAVTGVPLNLIPQIMMAKEAYDGKTMSDVVAEEGLDVPDPVRVEPENKKH